MVVVVRCRLGAGSGGRTFLGLGGVVAAEGHDAAGGAEQDPEHGAGEGWLVMEEGADPLGDGEHPLADRQRWQGWTGGWV
jgi:hypothetical protein